NAIMTESLSTSVLLILLACSIQMLLDQVTARRLLVFTLSALVGIQFRAAIFPFALVLLLPVALRTTLAPRRNSRRLKLVIAALLLVGAYFALPLLRWGALGEFFLPNEDFIALSHALSLNSKPSDDATRRLAELDLSPTVTPQTLNDCRDYCDVVR